MRSLKLFSIPFIIFVLFTTTGCSLFSSKEFIDPNNKNVSIVFGYIDAEETPSFGGIDWVTIKQYKPKSKYYFTDFYDGIFFHVGLPKGSYQVDNFGRHTRWYSNTQYTYDFGGKGRNNTARIIKVPGIYFLGTHKYRHIESESWLKADSFSMEQTKSPSERILLIKLLKIMQDDSDLNIYTRQINLIKKRIKKLK